MRTVPLRPADQPEAAPQSTAPEKVKRRSKKSQLAASAKYNAKPRDPNKPKSEIWGGVRPGAGRKPLLIPNKRKNTTVSIDPLISVMVRKRHGSLGKGLKYAAFNGGKEEA